MTKYPGLFEQILEDEPIETALAIQRRNKELTKVLRHVKRTLSIHSKTCNSSHYAIKLINKTLKGGEPC